MQDVTSIEIKYNKDNDVITFNDIMAVLENSCINHGLTGIDGLTDCPTAKFENILRAIGKMFNDTRALREPLYNKFNISKLDIVLNIYIYLCMEFNKGINLSGLYSLIGCNERLFINPNSIYNYHDDGLNEWSCYAREKLDEADDILQHTNARDSRQAILQLAYNNHRHNWSGVIKSNETRATLKTLDDIRRDRLSLTDGQ